MQKINNDKISANSNYDYVNEHNRIAKKFAELNAKNEKALVTYAMAGFPSIATSVSAITGMIKGGADIIEIGFPFSDPLADGLAIQEASNTSLNKGTTFEKFLNMAKKIRRANPKTPIILMTYTNILYNVGYGKALSLIADADIDGLILPDMSLDESTSYVATARKHGIDTIFLASPNTSRARFEKLLNVSSGFLYVVAVYGTTGIRKNSTGRGKSSIAGYTIDAINVAQRVSRQTNLLPIGIGFGISKPADVQAYVNAGVDAVVVGSAYVDVIKKATLSNYSVESRVTAFTKRLKCKTKL